MDRTNSETEAPANCRGWVAKFRNAFRGIVQGVCGQSSFYVHFTVALAVVIAGWLLQVTVLEWCLLIVCITSVLVAEMFNSALEALAKAIDTEQNPHLGRALDISSAAVLLASIGAVVLGTTLFVYRLGTALRWWS